MSINSHSQFCIAVYISNHAAQMRRLSPHPRPAQTPQLFTALEVEALVEKARAEERALLRSHLIESSALSGAATEAALSLREGGELLQPQELYAELIRERVLSAALQVQIDAMEERHRVQLATERSAALRLVEERTQATEARYRKELEAAQRRGRLLGQRQKEQQQVVAALHALNAQLLNEADPLLLSTSKLNWPRTPALQPPALSQAPPPLAPRARPTSPTHPMSPTAMRTMSQRTVPPQAIPPPSGVPPTPSPPVTGSQRQSGAPAAVGWSPRPRSAVGTACAATVTTVLAPTAASAPPRPRSAAVRSRHEEPSHAHNYKHRMGAGDMLETVLVRRWGVMEAPQAIEGVAVGLGARPV